jgi:hypothetical protein
VVVVDTIQKLAVILKVSEIQEVLVVVAVVLVVQEFQVDLPLKVHLVEEQVTDMVVVLVKEQVFPMTQHHVVEVGVQVVQVPMELPILLVVLAVLDILGHSILLHTQVVAVVVLLVSIASRAVVQVAVVHLVFLSIVAPMVQDFQELQTKVVVAVEHLVKTLVPMELLQVVMVVQELLLFSTK